MERRDRNGKRALILGATGGIGGQMAKRLLAGGWQVRAIHRHAHTVQGHDAGIEWVTGDALSAADVNQAANGGVDLIVHAVNPPGYKDWDKVVLPMLDNTIEAARANGSRIFLPGTVYNYGPDCWTDIREDSPQCPRTQKGAIRVEMERRLKQASDDGVAALVVRASDFFGPGARNNWFAQGLLARGKRKIMQLGKPGVGHQWAYLPDVAETVAQLLERSSDLPVYSSFNMQGVWDFDGRQMIDAILRATGLRSKVVRFPWWATSLASPFVPFLRELQEMRYLWQVPVRMHNDSLLAFLGKEPRTPLDDAVRATLDALP